MYTALFCAMAISQRIPCRAVSGLLFSPPFPRTYSSKGSPTDPSVYGSHVYAEFYLPSYGWIPVDASIGRGSGRPDSYFGHTHDPFLINSKGFGIRLIPPVQGVKNLWIFQHYVWWFWGDARHYDSYYTYSVETATTTEAATSTGESHMTLVPTTRSTLTESVNTLSIETASTTTTLPIERRWFHANWPYLVVAVAVVAVMVILLVPGGRHARSKSMTAF